MRTASQAVAGSMERAQGLRLSVTSIQQNRDAVLREGLLIALRRTGAHRCQPILARPQSIDELLWQLPQFGPLPAHHKTWLISRERTRQTMIHVACRPRVPRIISDTQPAHVDERCNFALNLGARQYGHTF